MHQLDLQRLIPSSGGDPLRILLVDDDPMMIMLMTNYLKHDSYLLEKATSGEEGWQLIQQNQPDLIISDWSMEGISGIVLCQRIKANPSQPNLKTSYFILLTAHSDIKHRVLALDAGADEFLSKPVDPSELQARVRAGLRQRLLARSLAQANQKLKTQNELLISLSLTDQLTGALNRRAMDEGIEHLFAATDFSSGNIQSCLSLLMIDIDRFKQINDTYGHRIGDEVLKAVAGRLKSNCTPESLLYRYGGEEFACITPNLDLANCQKLAEKLLQAIQRHLIATSEGLQIPVTISIGGAIRNVQNQVTQAELIDQADQSLYRAKNTGRNRMCMLEINS